MIYGVTARGVHAVLLALLLWEELKGYNSLDRPVDSECLGRMCYSSATDYGFGYLGGIGVAVGVGGHLDQTESLREKDLSRRAFFIPSVRLPLPLNYAFDRFNPSVDGCA